MNLTQTTPVQELTPAAYRYGSEPRPAYGNQEAMRQFAVIFMAAGVTADQMLDGIHPEDGLLHELADAIDALAAEGLGPAACREIAGLPALPEDGER